MPGKKNLNELIGGMTPKLNTGEYVFLTVQDLSKIDRDQSDKGGCDISAMGINL